MINTNLLLSAYPVGSLYLTTSNTNPATLFGGTWEKITSDAYLKIVSSGAGKLDGTSSDHKIPLSSMPDHNHGLNAGSNLNAAGTYYMVGWKGGVTSDSGSAWGTWGAGGGKAYYPYYYGIYVWRRTK